MPRPLETIEPGPTDRALFVGMTGSGKTTLAEQMLKLRDFVVVLDVKGTLQWKGYELHRTFKSLAESDPRRSPRLIYRPVYEELSSSEHLDTFFEWVYSRGNCTCYVDEVHGIARGEQYPFYLGACLQRGRELGICLWASTQRPKRIPSILLSEVEHIYVFRLKLGQDRERIEEVTGIDADSVGTLPLHKFLYAPQAGSTQGPLSLKLQR